MSEDRATHIWLSGKIVAWEDATFHVSSHSLQLGSGVFEAMRCYQTESGPAVFRLDDHLNRFFASAEIYGMPLPFTYDEIKTAVCDTINHNRVAPCYVRITAFYGPGTFQIIPRKCSVEIAIFALPFTPYDASRKGVRVHVSHWVKFHPTMVPTNAKGCGQYVNSLLALSEAVENGCDEALLLDINGAIAEGSGQNIFFVRNDRIVTNDEASSILPGITRASVIQLARDVGCEVQIRKILPHELADADEAFFTGTAVEITPIYEIDGEPIRTCPGTLTKKLQKLFLDTVSGQRPQSAHWLYYLDRISQ
jgi:branched-chain amino acid aminotransferase